MKSLLLFIFHSFKLVGIKSVADLRRRFGDPDISMPPNSTKEEWIKALENMHEKKGLNLESISYELIEEKNNHASKIIFTHIWLLGHYRNVMIVEEFEIGFPYITLGIIKPKMALKKTANQALQPTPKSGAAEL